MPRLLRQAGTWSESQTMSRLLEIDVHRLVWTPFFHYAQITYHLMNPLIVQAGIATQKELDELYYRMLIELYSDDFSLVWHLITVQGHKRA